MAEAREVASPKETIKYVEITKATAKPDRFNVWASAPKKDWQYVEIPAEDLHSFQYPDIIINQDIFKAGDRHFVPPMLAGEITRIMKRFEVECLALLQPKKRQAALKQVDGKGSRLSSVGATVLGLPGAADAMPGGE